MSVQSIVHGSVASVQAVVGSLGVSKEFIERTGAKYAVAFSDDSFEPELFGSKAGARRRARELSRELDLSYGEVA